MFVHLAGAVRKVSDLVGGKDIKTPLFDRERFGRRKGPQISSELSTSTRHVFCCSKCWGDEPGVL